MQLGRSFLFESPEPDLLRASRPAGLGLGEIVCDNMMTTAKALDFLAVENYIYPLRCILATTRIYSAPK